MPTRGERVKALTGAVGVPVLVVGRSVFNGFEPSGYQSLLDSAGYPKEGAVPARSQRAPVAPAPAAAGGRRQVRKRRPPGAGPMTRAASSPIASTGRGATWCPAPRNSGANFLRLVGADAPNRTGDLLITNQLLYQLSYISKFRSLHGAERPGLYAPIDQGGGPAPS